MMTSASRSSSTCCAPTSPIQRLSRTKWAVYPCLLMLLVVVAGCRPHLHDFLPPPSATPTTIVVADPAKAELFSLSMLSADDGWAVGTQGTILHYTGGNWVSVKSPIDTYLLAISMANANDGWIVGASHYNGTTQLGTMLHYVNGAWTLTPNPTTSYLDAITMLSPYEGWAVGRDILHYVDGRWAKVPNPDGGTLSRSSVAMTSANSGWAVSADGFIMHYTGDTWVNWNSPNPSEKLYGLAMASSDDGWAVGEDFDADSAPTHTLLMHYTDGSWVQVAAPTKNFLYAVSMVSSHEGWAVGAGGTILHYLNGSWSVAPSPTPYTLRAIQMLSPTDGWAVGVQGVILHYAHGTWAKVRG